MEWILIVRISSESERLMIYPLHIGLFGHGLEYWLCLFGECEALHKHDTIYYVLVLNEVISFVGLRLDIDKYQILYHC